MTHHRSAWHRVPPSVLAALRSDAVDAARLFGPTPTDEFVRSAWPLLRGRWLGGDPRARREVVAGLRARRLGDLDLPVGTRAEQLTYLASCRNSASLRRVVLAVILAPEESDPTREYEDEWEEFASHLELWLRSGEPFSMLLPERLAADRSPVRPALLVTPGEPVYLAAPIPEGLRGAFPDLGDALADAGWEPFTSGPHAECSNWLLEYDDPVRRSAIVLLTLWEVFGVRHPAFLTTQRMQVVDEDENS